MIESALPLLLASGLDRWLGEPEWLWRRFTHPIVVMGRAVTWLEVKLNRPSFGSMARRVGGVVSIAALVLGAIVLGEALAFAIWLAGWVPLLSWLGWGTEIAIVAVLLAGKSLRDHVAAVQTGFLSNGLAGGRKAVAMIVGRDPESLDEAGVVRAAVETSAENYSDGLIAPAFWYLLAGLPGILVYKIVNTADSMVGHRAQRYRDFGWAAARLDDVLNLVPARLSGVLIAAAAPAVGSRFEKAATVMWRDAGKHNSPNAGWPESAMAAALGVALAGPRTYGGNTVKAPWLNAREADKTPKPVMINAALQVTARADLIAAGVLAALAAVSLLLG